MSISTANPQVATLTRYRFVAVGSETSVSGIDANGAVLAYVAGKEQVYMNGVLLVRGQDYTATNGTSITALSALAANDVVEVLTFSEFVIANAVDQNLVNAKGDIIVATADNTVTNLAVGNNGETIVADSSTATGLRYQANFAAGKNKFINGDYVVWQRGTSFSVNSTSAYTADRWYCTSGSTTTTFSQVAFTPGAAPVSGYESAFYLNCAATSATASTTYVEQRIEDVRTLAGQTATISFWAKASTATTLTLRLDQSFGSGGSGGVANGVGTVSVTTAWVRYSATIAVPSVSGKTIGAGSYLDFFLYYSNAASLNVSFWGFQIEAGSTATAFQTATGTIQGELAACQRYYFRAGGDEAYQVLGTGITEGANIICEVRNPTTLRTKPSSIDYSTLMTYDGVTIVATSSASLGLSSRWVSRTTIVPASAPTNYRPYWLFTNNSTSSYIGFSAEL